ncbi:MAG: acyl-CoA dehydrogenase [Rhodocyclaceae bacterium]|uniref:Acyl-CoA dehydrogenase n=1 Tax=Candidatus Desulfobacillus denitrificans TaxID=2608985 RepID=A0A809QVJ0_9PROT|nr:acyl-CoA dehydrogenase [Candidatus Desulfobacillus denitrificans]GIK45357.1 MAG: acyl-CoA dehydrogenase [Betaproteobacteria bacterium]GJQ54245.1 MAG: acyl-CoA dehydrogenase [Rhodocyclaceae bacterium]
MLYTQEHLELQRSVKKFIESEINPHVDAWEAAEIFPAHELFKKMGDAGFLGINKPQEYGGMGLDYSFQLAFVEALGDVRCGGVPMAIGVQTDMATPALARFGSDALRREFLAPTIAGDRVCSIGVSEPGAGSDVASIKTFAKKDGDDYVITGTKMWITSGTQSDWICLLANTSEGAAHKNKTLICVPMKSKGVSVAKKLKKLGMWSSDTAQLYFDEVRVPQRYRIGEEGMGFTYQMQQFQEERLFAAAQWTALDRILRETIAYTRERQAFGQSILDNQYVHFRLAELKTEVEALRALVHDAATKLVAGEDVTMLASMAKLKVGRLGREVADGCLQFWGGMGYVWESSVSRLFRDIRLSSIGGGADEVMLGIIAKLMGTLPRKA